MADTVCTPLPTHMAQNPLTSQATNASPRTSRDRRLSTQSIFSVNTALFSTMIVTTCINWLVAEMQKRHLLELDWVPFSFDIIWTASVSVLFLWNLSKGRRFYFRHLSATSFTTFAHALTTHESSFISVQLAIDLGIFFAFCGEEFYPDQAPVSLYLPFPVQTPVHTLLPSAPRPTRHPR